MYILQCADDSYYTGSTKYLEKRIHQHQNGEGANHTKNRLPVKLVYTEHYPRIDLAFKREKQVQGWSRKKKEALINGDTHLLPELAKAYRDLESVASSTSATEVSEVPEDTNTASSTSATTNPSTSASITSSTYGAKVSEVRDMPEAKAEAEVSEVQVSEALEDTGFKRYPAYKDSGIEWMGEIPEKWRVQRIKFLFQEINERSDDGSEVLLSVSQYTGVTKKSDKVEEGDLLTTAQTLEGYKRVKTNDLVSNIMLAWNGSLGFSSFDGITSPAYAIYRLNIGNHERYFHYLLRTGLYKSEFKRNSTGVIESRLRLYTDDFFNVWSLLPPLEEQTAIANFLDDKTSKIDQAIAKKEDMIALLKERKQIMIQKAITKGLDQNVKMKDSGVELIGQIPEHWQTPKLKFAAHFVLDGTHGSFPRVEEGYRLLSVRNMIEDEFVFRNDDSRISTRHFEEISKSFLIQQGDVQLAIVGATLGKVAIINDTAEPFVTQRSVCTIRLDQTKCLPLFLFYSIKSVSFQSYLWLNAGFSAQPGVYLGTIQNSPLMLPSIDEQNCIVQYLQAECSKIDDSVSLQKTEIAQLKEYKATLIDSAVTGKIKVNSQKINN